MKCYNASCPGAYEEGPGFLYSDSMHGDHVILKNFNLTIHKGDVETEAIELLEKVGLNELPLSVH